VEERSRLNKSSISYLMLTVYTYNIPKPTGCFDLSYEMVQNLADTALAILSHHKTGVIWLGYLEGWMLDAADETKLRSVLRAFDCHVVTREPLSFSQAWKNEIDQLYTSEAHGPARINHNGGVIHRERETEHQPPSGVPSIDGVHY
jgi:hypothetical protein